MLAEGPALGVTDFLLDRLAEYQTFGFETEAENLGSAEAPAAAALVRGLQLLGVPEEKITYARRAQLPREFGPDGEGLRREPSACFAALEAYDPARRAEAVDQLSLLGTGVADALTARLTDPDPLVRAETARALGRLGVPRTLPSLSGRLQDPDQDVRLAASTAIRAIVTREATREVPNG